MNSPDDYMMNIFAMCSEIYHSETRQDYVMLSTGSNDFSMPSMWKKILKLEIDYDFLYNWYAASGGFSTVLAFLQFYHEFIACCGKYYPNARFSTCLTLGASQAVNISLKYFKNVKQLNDVILIGYNYSLFERECKKHEMNYSEVISEVKGRTLPDVNEIIEFESNAAYNSKVYVLTIPNNPTGEMWSKEEFGKFLDYIKVSNSYLLLDQVGLMPISKNKILLTEYLAKVHHAEENIVIANSFSKTESVPGFRIGYIYAKNEICKFAQNHQLFEMMNVPTFPIFPIVFSIIFRIIYLSQLFEWDINITKILRQTLRIADITCAIPNKRFWNEFINLLDLDTFMHMYESYVSEQLQKEQIMHENHLYTLKQLSHEIEFFTVPQGGFNFLVKLRKTNFITEIDFCKYVLEKSYISILTESCFTLGTKRDINFWVRFSFAKPKQVYQTGIDRLKVCLENFNP